jgi:hypothetical protein
MAEMDWLGVAVFEKEGNGKTSHLSLNPDGPGVLVRSLLRSS